MDKASPQIKHVFPLFVSAVGIVYGDIGTSPLYTVKECFSETGLKITEATVLGTLSLILWSLIIIVSIKYIFFILRADNSGEGGILALTALTLKKSFHKHTSVIICLGIIGASLFYGDAVLTPAVSVLSAVEGLSIYSSNLSPYILPITVSILFILFQIQSYGTHQIGRFFGPTMLVWFCVIGGLGLWHVLHHPGVLRAFNPLYGINFLIHYGWKGIGSLGAVVLAITGAEALYADMGHFGKSIIQRAWFFLVFPCLACNYAGQAALLLTNPLAAENPFYFMVPTSWVFPLMLLSTAATIIASQAVISGLFSMTWQAVQLGFLPRMRVIHTSSKAIGQVYVPTINKIIMFLTIGVVLLFKSSSQLAAAYGFAVTGIMVITTFLTMVVAARNWQWPLLKVGQILGFFLIIDSLFFIVNSQKVIYGGWMPLIIALGGIAVMTTWFKGRAILSENIIHAGKTILSLKNLLVKLKPVRVPGVAVYLNSTPENIPNSFQINFHHNKVLHEKVVFLSLVTTNEPRVKRAVKLHIIELGLEVYEIIYSIGFKESPNIAHILEHCKESGLSLDVNEASFFISRGIPVATIHPKMNLARVKLFIFLARNAMLATEYYKLPYNRVVELGVRIKI